MHAPTSEHMRAAKSICHYLYGTKSLCLVLKGQVSSNENSRKLKITAYTDSDHASDIRDRISISGGLIKINDCPVLWYSRKQKTISKSTHEAEIRALGECIVESKWVRNFMIELGVIDQLDSTVEVYCDKKAAVLNSKKDLANTKAKHIAVDYFFIKKSIDDREVKIEWVQSDEQVADLFTKPLSGALHKRHTMIFMGEC